MIKHGFVNIMSDFGRKAHFLLLSFLRFACLSAHEFVVFMPAPPKPLNTSNPNKHLHFGDADGLETLCSEPVDFLILSYQCFLSLVPLFWRHRQTPHNFQKTTKPGAIPPQKTAPATEKHINLSPYKTQDGESNGWIPLEQI